MSAVNVKALAEFIFGAAQYEEIKVICLLTQRLI